MYYANSAKTSASYGVYGTYAHCRSHKTLQTLVVMCVFLFLDDDIELQAYWNFPKIKNHLEV